MRSIPKRLVDRWYAKVYDHISTKGGDPSTMMSIHYNNGNQNFKFIKNIRLDELPTIRGMLIKIIQDSTPDHRAIGFVWGAKTVIVKRDYKGDIIIY